jgi:hypothetical protein
MSPADTDPRGSLAQKRRRIDDYDFNTPSPSYLPQLQPQYLPIRSADHSNYAQYVVYSPIPDGGPSSTQPYHPTTEIEEATEDKSLTVAEDADLSQCCLGMVCIGSIPYIRQGKEADVCVLAGSYPHQI